MTTTISKPNIVIIGASGHAKVIIDIIEKRNQYHIVGLIDSFKPVGSNIFDYKIIGTEDDLHNLKNKYNFNIGIIAIGDNWTRKKIHEKIIAIDSSFNFISAVHPNAVIGKNVRIGKGTIIMAGAVINSDAEIGKFCIINTKASLGHDGNLKKYASLAPNATIGGNVKIGTCTAICLGSNVIQEITIGKHSIVGSGSLIVRNVPDFTMVYGVPGKFIREVKKGEKYLYHNDKLIEKTAINNATLELITDEKQWNDTLTQIGKYDFYHTFDYHNISKSDNETPILIVYKNNNRTIALPLFLRDIPNTIYKDATSAYGYVGPIHKGIDSSFDNTNFVKKLKKYLIDINVISVFTRLNPYIGLQRTILSNFGDIVSQGKIVNIDITLDIDAQRAIYRSRLKTHINKSRRLCKVRKAVTQQDIQAYIDIYHENMDRVKAKKSYYFNKSYFKQLLNSDAFKSEILLAIDEESGNIIAGSMFITTNGIVQYHLSGTKNEYLHLTPTKLLIDEMRIIATKQGNTCFNLGGGLGGRDDDSLFDFKSSFSKDFKEFNLWKLIVNPEAYNDLVVKRGINPDASFFPLYRSLEELDIKL
jgi:sugar O-acyltransferase (sialic acid O-acetyltransferase NeuD family)